MTGRIFNNVIEVRQGDSFAINVDIKDCCCKPVDLTDAALIMQVREKGSNVLIFSLAGTAVDAQNGKMALLLTPTHTNNPVGDYVTDIQLTTADGSVNTIFPSDVNKVATFRITAQVTEA